MITISFDRNFLRYNIVKNIYNILSSIFIIFIFAVPVFAMNGGAPSVAVFGLPQENSNMLNSMTIETIAGIRNIFDRCGRFVPAENFRLNKALEAAEKTSDMETIFENISRSINADIYVVIGLYQIGNITYADLRVFSLNSAYKNLERKIVLRTGIFLNISIKIEREIAILHSGLPINASVETTRDDNQYIINAGQWHGLSNGKTYSTASGSISITETGRYASLVSIEGKKINEGDTITLKVYPETKIILNELEERLKQNAIRKYSIENILLKGDDPEKRLFESMCITNIGGNLCLPGYASYLSTAYMGFKDPSPSNTGIVVSTTAILTQICAPLIMTGFKANFFPWEKDPDKSGRIQDLQIFLWATLPVTYTVSYLDQLAFQFHENKYLPPFFEDSSTAAGSFSILIPGGGFFYKGRRAFGWSFYFSEMILAGYGIYDYSSANNRSYALISLVAIKVIDIIGAYLIKPSYEFYNMEEEGKLDRTTFNFGLNNFNRERIYNIMLSYNF